MLKTVTIECEVPDGYEAKFAMPTMGQTFKPLSDATVNVAPRIAEFDYSSIHLVLTPIPPRMVPLGPEDVVPGTVFKHPDWKVGFRYAEPCQAGIEIIGRIYTGQTLMADGWSYKTPSMTDWQKCEKAAP